ncbi:MAG: response regulator [Lachnospiraceae bacterium]|nr:response regulator [Lachnospiraceae bacterium]
MGIYSLGIGCIIITSVIAYLFFSVKRKNTKMHRIYGAMIITALAHLLAEQGALYTLTHVDTVPAWITRGIHQVFLLLFLVLFCEVYLYIPAMIADKTKEPIKKSNWILLPFALSTVGVLVLPIYYRHEETASYSYGPGIIAVYISVYILAITAATYLIRFRKIIPTKKKKAIAISLICEIGVGVYQVFNPTHLLSSVGVALLCIGFYLTVESPDNVLIELLVDEKKKVEEAREEAVLANQAKGRFLAQMSHEIRTPINAILGMDEIILRECKDANILEYADDINTAGQLLLSIVNEILDLSKIESGKMEIVETEYNLSKLIADLTAMISLKAQAKNLIFDIDVDNSLPVHLYGDDIRIRQILTNLLSNAIKYTKEGRVELSVKGEIKDNTVTLYCSVTDTGIGIKEEHLTNLFEEYKRIEDGSNHHIEGTGLGLNITMRLLNLMGSKLQVQSEYGKGSKFFFELKQLITDSMTIADYNKQQKQNQNPKQRTCAFTAPDAKLLVVDDNIMNRKVFAKLLEPTKMQIDQAESGFECIDKMKENRYDIVFLDHMMPQMDGTETLRRLREMTGYPSERSVIIALTANAFVGARQQYINEGFDDFLPKPIIYKDAEELILSFLPSQLVERFEEE